MCFGKRAETLEKKRPKGHEPVWIRTQAQARSSSKRLGWLSRRSQEHDGTNDWQFPESRLESGIWRSQRCRSAVRTPTLITLSVAQEEKLSPLGRHSGNMKKITSLHLCRHSMQGCWFNRFWAHVNLLLFLFNHGFFSVLFLEWERRPGGRRRRRKLRRRN